MKTELRDGLVEVPGGLPTFASDGLEGAASTIGGIAADSYEYLAGLLGIRPEAQVLVLSEADWAVKCDQPLYGLPNAGDGTLTVAGTEARFWADLADMVADDDRAELEAVYEDAGRQLRFGPFFDLIAVHEVGHLFSQGYVAFPRSWLSEFFANRCLHAWVEQRSPASLETLLTLPGLGAKAAADTWPSRTWVDFDRDYSSMPGPNYVWFQFRLQVAAAELYGQGGEDTVRRLFEVFRHDDRALVAVLTERVGPGFDAFLT